MIVELDFKVIAHVIGALLTFTGVVFTAVYVRKNIKAKEIAETEKTKAETALINRQVFDEPEKQDFRLIIDGFRNVQTSLSERISHLEKEVKELREENTLLRRELEREKKKNIHMEERMVAFNKLERLMREAGLPIELKDWGCDEESTNSSGEKS
jgi:dynactin complex subunit